MVTISEDVKEWTTLTHFFKIWKQLIKKVHDDWSVAPNPAIHSMEPDNIQTPLITYKTYHREIGSNSGKKPTYKEEVTNPNDESTIITKYSQKFKSIIEFKIYGEVYSEANQTRDEFENLMIDYIGYFKRKGIIKIFFIEQLEDDVFEVQDQYFPQQTLRYYVSNERVKGRKKSKIDQIDSTIQEPDDLKYIKSQLDIDL